MFSKTKMCRTKLQLLSYKVYRKRVEQSFSCCRTKCTGKGSVYNYAAAVLLLIYFSISSSRLSKDGGAAFSFLSPPPLPPRPLPPPRPPPPRPPLRPTPPLWGRLLLSNSSLPLAVISIFIGLPS